MRRRPPELSRRPKTGAFVIRPTSFDPANTPSRSGLQPALDWLLEHQDDPEPTAAELEAEANNTKLDEDEEGAPGGLAEAKASQKECGT